MNEIKTGSAVQLFERGDYSAAYLRCDSNDNLKGCSLILLGLFERGLSLLNSSADDRTKFCSAVAYWGLNKNAAALEILEHISPDSSYHRPSKTLKKLVGAPKLRVLLQARDDPSLPSSDAVGAAKNLSMADIVTIGHSSRSDIKINLQSTIGDVIAELPAGWDPDFYLCDMVEDHPPPLGLPSAPFPTFYSTQDFDRHYHHCHGALSEFDAGIAFGSVFHKELEQLTNGPTFVCPLLMGVDTQDTPVDLVPKEFDMFVSGNLFNHSKQKTKYLWELSQLSEKYNFKYLNTHTSVEKYKEYLRKSKYTFTYVQNWGITNSRAFEAIIEGCGAFFQEGSELGIFLSDCVEAVSYREDNLISVVGEALKKSDK